jgi:hypothetical protein
MLVGSGSNGRSERILYVPKLSAQQKHDSGQL